MSCEGQPSNTFFYPTKTVSPSSPVPPSLPAQKSPVLLPSWAAGFMYFFTFVGAFAVAWMCLFLSGYFGDIFGKQIDPVTFQKGIIRISTLLCIPIGLYVIYVAYQSQGRSAFSGLSWCMIVVGVLTCYRAIVQDWYWGGTLLFPLRYAWPFVFVFAPILAFSVRMDKKNHRLAFLFFMIPMFLIGFFMLLSYYDLLWAGHNARSKSIWPKLENWSHLMFGTPAMVMYRTGFWGGALGIVSLWGLWTKRMRCEIAAIGYVIGTAFVFFSGSQGYFMAWVFTHVFVFLAGKMWQSKRVLYTIVPILIINILIGCHIGSTNKAGVLSRLGKTFLRVVEQANKPSIARQTNSTTMGDQADIDRTSSTAVKTRPADQTNVAATSRRADKTKPFNQASAATVADQEGENNNMPPEQIEELIEEEVEDTTTIRLVGNPYSLGKRPPRGQLKRSEFENLNIDTGKFALVDTRIAYWICAIRLIRDNPILGCGSYLIFECNGEYRWDDPHNLILTAFLSMGVIGGGCFLVLVFRCFIDTIIILHRNREIGWLAVLFVFVFVGHLFAYNYNDPFVLLPLVALRAYVHGNGGEDQEIEIDQAMEGLNHA